MANTISNPKNDRRSLTHTGQEVGSSNINRSQNSADRLSEVLAWTCPRKYDRITYSAGDHYTKFLPRYRESFDGDGSKTTFSLTGIIGEPNGESDVSNMRYQPVVAYDDAAGSQLDVESYDFATNEVTFTSAPDSGTGNVIMWPVITEGIVKYVGLDQFNNQVASLDTWGIPLHVFNDFDQAKRMTRTHLTGAAQWQENETLSVQIDSPRQVVWDDADYPNGEYASTIEQKVDVDV